MEIKPEDHYQKNEYCFSIACAELSKRLNNRRHQCKNCEAYKFHDYLISKEYSIVKLPK